jgi:hypothetical protein
VVADLTHPQRAVGTVSVIAVAQELSESVTPETLRQLEAEAREAARAAGLFTGSPDVPWSRSLVASDDIPAAIEHVSAVQSLIAELRSTLQRIGVQPVTVADLRESAAQLGVARAALAVFNPAVLGIDDATRAVESRRCPTGPSRHRVFLARKPC